MTRGLGVWAEPGCVELGGSTRAREGTREGRGGWGVERLGGEGPRGGGANKRGKRCLTRGLGVWAEPGCVELGGSASTREGTRESRGEVKGGPLKGAGMGVVKVNGWGVGLGGTGGSK